MTLPSDIFVILLCMVGAAFFSGIETGVISIHIMRLRHLVKQGVPEARILQKFLDNSNRLFGTTLVGTNICIVTISIVAASLAVDRLGAWGETISTVVMAMLVLVFCEYIPKAWFHSRPLERCRLFARVLRSSEIALRPIAATAVWLTRWLVPGSSKPFSQATPFVTREDLKVLAHEGEKDGMLSSRERDMIHRVFELSGKRASQIMIPRSEMTVIASDTPIRDYFEEAREKKFTRIPVCDSRKDKFVGVINVIQVLSTQSDNEEKTVADFMRPPLFIPETMPVDDIFPRLRRARQPMCLVTNKESNVIGLITTEDILEEIVGKL